MNRQNKQVRVGCGALIINEKDETLLIKRGTKAKNQSGIWSQPGGAIDFGETVEHAIKREIDEELDVTVKLIKYLCYTNQILNKESQHWVTISYLAEIIKGEPKNLEAHKHDDMRWFPVDKLPSKLSITTKDSTKAYLSSRK